MHKFCYVANINPVKWVVQVWAFGWFDLLCFACVCQNVASKFSNVGHFFFFTPWYCWVLFLGIFSFRSFGGFVTMDFVFPASIKILFLSLKKMGGTGEIKHWLRSLAHLLLVHKIYTSRLDTRSLSLFNVWPVCGSSIGLTGETHHTRQWDLYSQLL